MSETKWTPGPWTADTYNRFVRRGHGAVAEVAFRIDDSEPIANCHLIAAAPDLYAALEAISRCQAEWNVAVIGSDIELGGSMKILVPMATRNIALAALAKARGESK